MRDYLFNTEKIKYVKGEKPDVPCILCAIRDRDPGVKNLEIFRSGGFIISVNLYPFNPGHLMIFPSRHIEDFSGFSDDEALALHHLQVKTLEILKEEFSPRGFNIGYNLGAASGASIAHIHTHIVPRYDNEIGFIDVLGGARVIVVDPLEVKERLEKRFSRIR
jgi:ATP adenylyltransferase